MKQRTWIAVWCIGIAAIIGVTLYAELASKPSTPIVIYPPSTSEAMSTPTSTIPRTESTTLPTEPTPSETTSITYTTCTTTTTICRDLNAATLQDLQRVEGIGQVLAEAILSERTRLGGFSSTAQLLEIPGIGEVLSDRILAEFEIPSTLPQTTVQSTSTTSATTSLLTTQPSTESTTASTTREAAGYYNINVVTRAELLLIEGVDEQMADDILALRDLIHYFSDLSELMYVDGMDGGFVLNVLKNHLYVGERSTQETSESHPS